MPHTKTDQSRTILIDIKKGESLKLTNSFYKTSIKKLTFCISLVRAHDVQSNSALKVLPKTDTVPGEMMTFNIQLSGTHDHLATTLQ